MKGISNLITTVFLVAIAVSVATLYSSWAPDFAGNLTQSSVDQTNHDIKCRNAGVSISNPVYDLSANSTLFDVVNSGNIRFTDTVEIIALNTSIQNRTEIQGLEVGESVSESIDSTHKPRRLVVSTAECPSLEVERTQIRTRD